jgi:hypothetical protein
VLLTIRGVEYDYEGVESSRPLLQQFKREPLAVGSKMMTLTVRYRRKKHTNDRCEVTDDMSGSEVRGRDLRVTNDEVEREGR